MRRSKVRALFAAIALTVSVLVLQVGSRPANEVLAAGAEDAVLEWNGITARTARAAGRPPPVLSFDFAMVHAAIYDAVNSIDGGHTPYAVQLSASPDASREAAAAAAAHTVLLALFPAQQPSLDADLGASLSRIPDGEPKAEGIAIGERAGRTINELRAGDGRFANVAYAPGSGPGVWERTPPAFAPPLTPWVAQVRPFTMRVNDQFLPDAPPPLTSAEYTDDFNEVKVLGAKQSIARTAEQTSIARFWDEPPSYSWNRTLRDIASSRGQTVAENARLFALVNLAEVDARITSWDAKYTYSLWRPITAIQRADTDGNPATIPDPSWEPLLTTPNFPEYISGHTTASATVTQVMSDFYGTDHFPFTVTNGAGVTRSFSRFSDAAQEVSDARVYSGIHFRSGDAVGSAVGKRVAGWVVRNYLLPVVS